MALKLQCFTLENLNIDEFLPLIDYELMTLFLNYSKVPFHVIHKEDPSLRYNRVKSHL